jgi:hypothetical protein
MKTPVIKALPGMTPLGFTPPAVKAVLHWMAREHIGAVVFEGGYKFPEHFRREPEMAKRFLERGMAGFEAEVIRK